VIGASPPASRYTLGTRWVGHQGNVTGTSGHDSF
jgi:hypothetical protein